MYAQTVEILDIIEYICYIIESIHYRSLNNTQNLLHVLISYQFHVSWQRMCQRRNHHLYFGVARLGPSSLTSPIWISWIWAGTPWAAWSWSPAWPRCSPGCAGWSSSTRTSHGTPCTRSPATPQSKRVLMATVFQRLFLALIFPRVLVTSEF